ncbi:MAG: peptidylprolyl isomerase [Porticoccaceae bacterium]|nr:peptidylprolyl isomerase [Porticoccaceae bacterium]
MCINRVKQTFLFSCAILTGVLGSLSIQAEIRLLDSVAAVVDNDVVMTSELNERVDTIYARIQQSGTEPPPREALVPQVLDRLILERIQIAMALRAGLKISDAELNQAVARIAQQQGLSAEQFVEEARKNGLPIHVIKEQMMMEMMLSQVQESQVNRRIVITEQEIDNLLTSKEGQVWNSPEVELGHILLPLSAAASPEEIGSVNAKASTILEQLDGGADFRQMAITYSGDQTALQGGDIGWRRTAQLPEVFIPIVNELEPGQVSQPIRSDAGIHILKLYDRRGADKKLITQHFARHILLKPNEIRGEDDTRAELEKIADKIRDGADFAEMAREHSEDIGSALSGGELGWSVPGRFVPQFEAVMNDISLKVVSDPFRSQFGWHILQVTERRNQDFSDEIKRGQAENILRQRKFDEELQVWLQEIRDNAYVEIKI